MKRVRCLAAAGLLCVHILAAEDAAVIRVDVPDHPTIILKQYSSLSYSSISESSRIVRSRSDPGRYWTHNDSGDFARIFPVDEQGNIIKTHVRIKGAANRDWEDIAADDEGRLFIADIGNNFNTRKDLGIYIIDEPDPAAGRVAEGARRIPVHYPDQDAFPPAKKNFDAEALFWARGRIYVLTKHRSDTYTTLYRLDSLEETTSNALTRLATFDTGGQVTGADASPDGNRIVLLTYASVWMFEADTDDYFRGKVWWLPIAARQCEGICFDGTDIMITNEQRQIFRVAVDQLIPLQE